MLLPIGNTYSMTAKTNVGFAFGSWTESILNQQSDADFRDGLEPCLHRLYSSKPPHRELTIATSRQRAKEMTNALARVAGTASDDWGVGSVWLQLNGGLWNLVSSTNAYTNWTAIVTLKAGTNTINALASGFGRQLFRDQRLVRDVIQHIQAQPPL